MSEFAQIFSNNRDNRDYRDYRDNDEICQRPTTSSTASVGLGPNFALDLASGVDKSYLSSYSCSSYSKLAYTEYCRESPPPKNLESQLLLDEVVLDSTGLSSGGVSLR